MEILWDHQNEAKLDTPSAYLIRHIIVYNTGAALGFSYPMETCPCR